MALIDDEDAATVLKASAVDVDRMRARLTDVLDGQVTSAAVEAAPDAKPTAAVQRAILRVALDALSYGSSQATGANLLAALFSERDYQVRQGQLDSRYKVLLLNDDYTPMEFVVQVLERFFDKSREDATRIMLHVHSDGVGICGVYTLRDRRDQGDPGDRLRASAPAPVAVHDGEGLTDGADAHVVAQPGKDPPPRVGPGQRPAARIRHPRASADGADRRRGRHRRAQGVRGRGRSAARQPERLPRSRADQPGGGGRGRRQADRRLPAGHPARGDPRPELRAAAK